VGNGGVVRGDIMRMGWGETRIFSHIETHRIEKTALLISLSEDPGPHDVFFPRCDGLGRVVYPG